MLGDYYYDAKAGGYEAHLVAKDRDVSLVDMRISAPTEDIAETICNKWEEKNQKIYQYLVGELFKAESAWTSTPDYAILNAPDNPRCFL